MHAACCYTDVSVRACVRVSVGNNSEPAETAELIEMTFWGVDSRAGVVTG